MALHPRWERFGMLPGYSGIYSGRGETLRLRFLSNKKAREFMSWLNEETD